MSAPGPPPLPTALERVALDGETTVAVAVSGGGDSTALLLLLLDHLASRGGAIRPLALTVDHGLRPKSAAEAAEVAALCRRFGVEHRTLFWTGSKPAGGLAEAARLARHRLIAEAAQAAGARIVLTGHTADDQAETVAMRAARGSGPGLAGMAPATLFARAVWFVRPLIGVRRAGLRAFLAARGQGWIEDPSNKDPLRERARIRKSLGESGNTGSLIETAGAMALERRRMSARVAEALGSRVSMAAPGLVRIAPGLCGDEDCAAETLRVVAACAGGLDRLPDLSRARLLAARIGEGERLRVTFGRCVVDASAKGTFLHREWRGGGPATIACRAGAVFDGRYAVASAPLGGCRVGPAGASAPRGSGRLADAAARAEPAIAGDSCSDVALTRLVSPWATFLPEFDLVAAEAAARLVEAQPFGPSPWR